MKVVSENRQLRERQQELIERELKLKDEIDQQKRIRQSEKERDEMEIKLLRLRVDSLVEVNKKQIDKELASAQVDLVKKDEELALLRKDLNIKEQQLCLFRDSIKSRELEMDEKMKTMQQLKQKIKDTQERHQTYCLTEMQRKDQIIDTLNSQIQAKEMQFEEIQNKQQQQDEQSKVFCKRDQAQKKQIAQLTKLNQKLEQENIDLNLRMMRDLDSIIKKQDIFSKQCTQIMVERSPKLNHSQNYS